MHEIWHWSNLGLAFAVELAGLGIFALWGWRTGGATPTRLLLAIGLPLLAAVLWGLFAAPTANYGSPVLTAAVKIAFLGLAGLALWNFEHRVLGIAFVVVVAANVLIIQSGNLNTDSPAAGKNSAVQSN